MSNTYIIYKHTNKINNKSYIGQTCQDPKIRWRNGKGYKPCIKFYNAIQKYGWENFSHQILESNLTLEQANQKEIYYIKLYDSVNNGYNLREGGDGKYLNSPELYQKHQRAIVRTTAKPVICINTKTIYKSASQAYRQTGINHIGDCCNKKIKTAGRDQNGYGLIWRWVQQYDPSQNFIFIQTDKTIKKVKCINTNKIYNNQMEAYRDTGVEHGSISKCCHKKRKSAGKDINGQPLRWEFIYN